MSVWFWTDVWVANAGILATRLTTAPPAETINLSSAANNRMESYVYGKTTYALLAGTAAAIPTGTWHHCVVVYNSTATPKEVMYLDDTWHTAANTTIGTATNNAVWSIGWDPYGTARSFNGRIDDARLYNRALTSNEWRSLHFTEGRR